MAKGRTVAVRITADTKGLVAGVTRAEVNLNNLRKTAVAGTAVLARMAAVGIGAATGALTALYVRTAPLIDRLAKTSDKLGVTTEALAGMHLAAELTGVSVNTMDMALQRMVRRVSEAANGTGEAVKALKELGINAQELARQSPDEQFKRVSDAMESVGTQGDRVRLAMKLFDSEGVALVNTLGLTRSGLDETALKAQKYGTALSRVDAAKVEAANDAWTEAQEITKGFANRITVQLAPIVQGLIDVYKEASLESRGFSDSIQTGFNAGVKAVGFFADAIHGLRVVVKGVEVAIAGLMTVGIKAWDTLFTGLAKGINFALGSINGLTAKINKVFKTDIPSITFNAEDTGIVKAFSEMSDVAGIRIQELVLEMQSLAMQELPSDRIEAFVAKVQEASQKAAEAVAANRKAMFEGGDTTQADKKMEEDLEKFREFHLSRETAEIESLHRSLNEIKKFHDAGLVSTGEFWGKSAQITTKSLASMTASVANHSKKAFDLNKKLSIVNTIINTYEMATAAYKAMAGIPYVGPALGAIAAAAAIKFGQMQVQGIKSAQFGGGVAPSAANTPAPATTPVGGGAGAAGQQQTLMVQGLDSNALFSGNAVAELASKLLDFQKDGGKVVLT